MTNAIFITGAGAGIGRETALLFASRGWFVGATDLDEASFPYLKATAGAQVINMSWASASFGIPDFESAQFRVLWPLTRSAPSAITRSVMKRLWK